MSNPFFDHPILNSPYSYPTRHWELDDQGQPTQRIMDARRGAKFVTPIPKPKKRKRSPKQEDFVFDEGEGLSTRKQQYDATSIINEVRGYVESWRALPNPSQWQVTPETARLLQHWRHDESGIVRPFFCQVEAIETAIWLTEVAPQSRNGKRLLDLLAAANKDANPELSRLALKLATGAGKTTVMAMLIAWQTVNAVRHPTSKSFTRGFLICAPGLTIKDRLRVLQPNDPDSYYAGRNIVPNDMIDGGFDVLIACAFNYEAHTTEFNKLGRLPVLKARMNADLHMAEDLKNTGKGNLFVIFGEPDIDLLHEADGRLRVKIKGVDVFKPQTGEVISDSADGIACWFVDHDYNEESFFVRQAYFLGANDPYSALKTTLKAEIDRDAWESLHSDSSRPFEKPKKGRIAVKVINHLGDEVMKVFRV